MPSARAGMMWPGIDAMSPVSAAIRPSIEPLPNCSFSLLDGLRGGVRHPGAGSPRRRPGISPVSTPMTPERSTVGQYCTTSRKRGSTESFSSIELALDRIGERRQHLGEAERADQRRDQRDAAGELAPAEGEAVVGIEAFLADLRDEQAERAHQPALERIVADDAFPTWSRRTGPARRTRTRRTKARPRRAPA